MIGLATYSREFIVSDSGFQMPLDVRTLKKLLNAGEHDITPEKFHPRLPRLNLLVNTDGRGILRVLATDPTLESVLYRTSLRRGDTPTLEDSRVGGRIIRIPEDAAIIPITGPRIESATLGEQYYFGMLVYMEGISPSRIINVD